MLLKKLGYKFQIENNKIHSIYFLNNPKHLVRNICTLDLTSKETKYNINYWIKSTDSIGK